jgi:23S rRNA (uracil1939-C5)-methyltransferase
MGASMKPKPRLNQKINTTIQRLGIYGEGIGYWHGYTVFVDGALPGELVHARLIERKKKYGRGSIETLENPSPSRVKPPCPLFGKCGGCQLMHLDYKSQLEMKRQRVADAFERIGKLESADVLPCIPSPSPLAYRNKIQMPIRKGPDGLRIGFNARNSHELAEVDFCHIHCPLGQEAYETARDVIKNSSLTAYDWQTESGEMRYLIIKTAVKTEQVLVLLVTSGPASEELKETAKKMMNGNSRIRGVVHNINPNPDNVVLGEEFALLAGEGHIEEEICGLFFKISPASFFQVNPEQAENLYRKVEEYAELDGSEIVLDAYCGVGTMSLILSRKAKEVIGVECVPQAIVDAKANAKRNAIENAAFVCEDSATYIQRIEKVDVAVLNPPRKGCEKELLDKIGSLRPKKVVYVSCDPATLARDLQLLTAHGYRVTKAQPFDMFPQTAHVETVVQLHSD